MPKTTAGPRRQGNRKQQQAARVFGAGSELVRSAAVVLDQEMAIGITAAKAVQKRIAEEGRIEPADFRDAMQRFQTDARDLVNSLDAQLTGSKLPQNVELAKRFIARANDMVDLAVGFITTSAELANELIRTNLSKTAETNAPTRKRRGQGRPPQARA